jgi:hypothetical protein
VYVDPLFPPMLVVVRGHCAKARVKSKNVLCTEKVSKAAPTCPMNIRWCPKMAYDLALLSLPSTTRHEGEPECSAR